MLRINHSITQFLVSIIIFCLGLLYFFYAYTSLEIYILYFLYLRTAILFAICLAPLSFIGMLMWLITHSNGKYIILRSILILLLICGGNVLACLSTPFAIFNDYRHYATVSFENHQYHLDSEAKPGVGSDFRSTFLFWRCDQWNINCELLYPQDNNNIDISEAAYQNVDAALIVDEFANSITILINGEVVWTYRP